MTPNAPRIIEQDGDIVRIVAGDVEVIAQMIRGPDELLFDRLSIDGAGPGSVGLASLKELARQEPRCEQNPRARDHPNDRSQPRKGAARDRFSRIMD